MQNNVIRRVVHASWFIAGSSLVSHRAGSHCGPAYGVNLGAVRRQRQRLAPNGANGQKCSCGRLVGTSVLIKGQLYTLLRGSYEQLRLTSMNWC